MRIVVLKTVPRTLDALYDNIAKECGYEPEVVGKFIYDCTKIRVSQDIIENQSNRADPVQFYLVNRAFGPDVDKTLFPKTVAIEDGFFCLPNRTLGI